jgi:NAD(P)-dependent dehydrogenase (short-subunit alcohol dehydrogenase family)
VVQRVLQAGEIAIAAMRNPENDAFKELQTKHGSQKLLIVQLDVTKEDEVKTAFAKAKETFGRIDVVFNNAGITLVGELESIPVKEARGIFEVSRRLPDRYRLSSIKQF